MRAALHKRLDRWTVRLEGGLRLRLEPSHDPTAPRLSGRAHGLVPGPPPARLLSELLELHPPAPGVVHLWHDGHGAWRLRTSARLAQPAFRQRVLNVVGNC